MQCGTSYAGKAGPPSDTSKQNVVTNTLGTACGRPPMLPSVAPPTEGVPGSLALNSLNGDLMVAQAPASGRFVPVNGRHPFKLLIYYGYPSLMNAIPTLEGVAQALAEYDLVVLGDGLEHPAHGDHANTLQILQLLRVFQPGTLVAGYIDLGVSTQNLTEAQMGQYTREWAAMGVDLIFWDDAGYDFLVTRERQSFAIKTARAYGMNSFMNAFNPNDLFAGPKATCMTPADWFLLESLPFNDTVGGGAWPAPGWNLRASVISRVNSAQAWRAQYGSRIAAVSIVSYNLYTEDVKQYIRYTCQAFGFVAGLDAYGDCAQGFSAFGGNANQIFKGAWDEEMGRTPGRVSLIPVSGASIVPDSFDRYDYRTRLYYDELFVSPTWAVECPRTRVLAPFGLASGQPPAGQKGRLAFNNAGVYVYDTGATWNAV